MIKFFPYFLALIGIMLLSFVVHELVHLGAAPHPTEICIGLNTNNATNVLKMSGGHVSIIGEMPFYGSEWVAYSVQLLFIMGMITLLIKKG